MSVYKIMPLYEIADSALRLHQPASFAGLGVRERADLQRLLREQVDVLGDDLLVIAEEFGNWEDARRRIDLLAIDTACRLVVIELKRTEDGGHMDLQALRYAAMISSMRFDEVVDTYASFLAVQEPATETAARAKLLDFLSVSESDDDPPQISTDVRIILAAANFGREITTAVLWLNEFDGMDIRCFRLVPYDLETRVLINLQQVIPLPEAADYQVRVRRKVKEQDRVRTDQRDMTRYQVVIDGRALPPQRKRQAVRVMIEQLLERGASAADIARVLPNSRWRSVPGEIREPDALTAAFREDAQFSPTWWFIDKPFVHDGRTWILSKHWGRDTEPALKALGDAFARLGVTYRAETQPGGNTASED